MEKLMYLKKYSKNIELLDFQYISENDKIILPDYWIKALTKKTVNEKVETVLSEWDKFNFQFQSTVNYLYNNLVDIELMKNNNELVLLYSIKNKNGKEIYYVGKNPKTINIQNNKKNIWVKLPDTIKNIYENLHNGWYYFASESNGLSSVENMIVLNEIEWGILDEIKTLPYKLENCIGIFHNGSGNYVCYDIETKDKNNGFIWYKTKEPRNNIKLWPVIDEWTKLSMEE
jgi:hypothetical protein